MRSCTSACLNAPKYGNDDDYVDELYDMLSTKVPEIMTSRIDPITGKKPMLFIMLRRRLWA
jgi:hypothetical protein